MHRTIIEIHVTIYDSWWVGIHRLGILLFCLLFFLPRIDGGVRWWVVFPSCSGINFIFCKKYPSEANAHTFGVLRQVPPVALTRPPSLHPNPLGEALIVVRSVIDTAKDRRLGGENVKKSAAEGRSGTSSVWGLCEAKLRGPRLEARILVSATTAAKFFAYFSTPKSRAPLTKRQLLALAGQAFLFVYHTKRNQKSHRSGNRATLAGS